MSDEEIELSKIFESENKFVLSKEKETGTSSLGKLYLGKDGRNREVMIREIEPTQHKLILEFKNVWSKAKNVNNKYFLKYLYFGLN